MFITCEEQELLQRLEPVRLELLQQDMSNM